MGRFDPFLLQDDSLGAWKWVKVIKVIEYITFIQLPLWNDLHVQNFSLHVDSIEVKCNFPSF